MNQEFYMLNDDSFGTRGCPWLQKIVSGHVKVAECIECGGSRYRTENILGKLDRRKGTKWPDALGCGAASLFIVSKKVLDVWRNEGIGEFPRFRVSFAEPLPRKLEGTTPPEYYWLDGSRMQGAEIDFEASGYVNVRACPVCGRVIDDVSKTYRKQRSATFAHVFVQDSWSGAHVFTTNLTPFKFFCTQRVVEVAKKYRLTNFSFVPIERSASSVEPIRYL